MTELHSAIRPVGCKVQRRSQEVERHSAIAQVELLARRTLLVTEQPFATQAAKLLRLRAPTVIVRRSARRVAAAWAPLISQKIRPPFEMPVVAQLDRHPPTEVELPFATALGGRLDLQATIGDNIAANTLCSCTSQQISNLLDSTWN